MFTTRPTLTPIRAADSGFFRHAHIRREFTQQRFGTCRQFVARAAAAHGQQRIETGHQTLAGKVRVVEKTTQLYPENTREFLERFQKIVEIRRKFVENRAQKKVAKGY